MSLTDAIEYVAVEEEPLLDLAELRLCVTHDSFKYVTTHLLTWHGLIHICAVTHLYMSHTDAIEYVAVEEEILLDVAELRLCVTHDSFINVTWLIY